jgi:HlyD family secretion protein
MLFDLAGPGHLEIVADVLSTDAVRIPVGAPMRVVDWGGPDTLYAHVRLVEPSGFTRVSALGVEEQRVRVVGDLREAASGLGDGYRVEVRIVTWASDDALQVPSAALFTTPDGPGVFIVEDGRARLRAVRIGERGAEAAQVLDGLEDGDTVVLFPPDDLEDGARVQSAE